MNATQDSADLETGEKVMYFGDPTKVYEAGNELCIVTRERDGSIHSNLHKRDENGDWRQVRQPDENDFSRMREYEERFQRES